MAVSKVYMIATPIGNLEDITQRALRCLRELPVFFAEDTRELTKLFGLLGISTEGKRFFSFSSHNMKEAQTRALEQLREGKNIGFVCDRGTPCISDPGYRLADAARREGHEVLPVPGPSSVMALLSVAGIDTDRFCFIGFPPLQNKERTELWDKVAALRWPVCFFESPKRFVATLAELKVRFPAGRVVVGREMTKQFEQYTPVQLATFDASTIPEKGEFCVLLEPGPLPEEASSLDEWVSLRLSSEKEWAKWVAKRCDISSSEAYNALQKRKS